ncbi:MAG: hypothetical protein DLM57_14470 [Pseudonocardiales bacterium]|nr:MAG: hypothetical protein DLM57_14470 [Pseudonocardiales bacterium]
MRTLLSAPVGALRVERSGAMSWWVWLVVIVVVAVIVVGGLLAIQFRRRRGGVIVDPGQSPRTRGRRAGR